MGLTTASPTSLYEEKNPGAIGNILGKIGEWRQKLQGADYAMDQNIEMWNMQNQYNSPTAQMERLKKAGLNPNMVYGQNSAGSTGQASDIGKYSSSAGSVSAKLPNVLGMLGQFQDIRRKTAEATRSEIITNAMMSDPSGVRAGILGKYQGQGYDASDKAIDLDIKEAMSRSDKYGKDLGSKTINIRDTWLYRNKAGKMASDMSRSQASASNQWLTNSMLDLDERNYKWTKWLNLGSNTVGNLLKVIFLKGKK